VRELLHTEDHRAFVEEHPEVPATLVAEPVMRRLSEAVTPPGLVAVVETPLRDAPFPLRGPVLVLDRLNDPGNVGTLIRSAAALGASAVVVTDDSADPFGPKAVRASAGACYRLPVLRRAALVGTLAEASTAGLSCFGLSASGAASIDTIAGRSDVALILGSESHGLGPDAADLATLRIPMAREVESLNVAAAGAIALQLLSTESSHGPEGRSAP
jgi:TrmH family RNA methyltransferase